MCIIPRPDTGSATLIVIIIKHKIYNTYIHCYIPTARPLHSHRA